MVLVDTSIWIKFVQGTEPFRGELAQLISREQVTGHELVYGELLIGDQGGRQKLLLTYGQLDYAEQVPHHEVVQFVRDRKFHGRGAGWIDVHLLASAIVGRMQFWTADERLAALARECGVAYRP